MRDFPTARFICHPEAIDDIKSKKGFRALIQGFLPGLLPNDFYERLILLDNKMKLATYLYPFSEGYDLFNDDSMFAIPLPDMQKVK